MVQAYADLGFFQHERHKLSRGATHFQDTIVGSETQLFTDIDCREGGMIARIPTMHGLPVRRRCRFLIELAPFVHRPGIVGGPGLAIPGLCGSRAWRLESCLLVVT